MNTMLIVYSQGANATIPSALHGENLCLIKVVREPWHI